MLCRTWSRQHNTKLWKCYHKGLCISKQLNKVTVFPMRQMTLKNLDLTWVCRFWSKILCLDLLSSPLNYNILSINTVILPERNVHLSFLWRLFERSVGLRCRLASTVFHCKSACEDQRVDLINSVLDKTKSIAYFCSPLVQTCSNKSWQPCRQLPWL